MNRLALLLLVAAPAFAAEPETPVAVSTEAPPAVSTETVAVEPPADPSYILTGDLDELLKKGTLRFLVPAQADHMPRVGDPRDQELDLARAFAEKLRLKPVFVPSATREAMLEDLNAGRGDVVAVSLTETEERREKIAFSRPLRYVEQQLVVREGDDSVKTPKDLAGKTVTVRLSSSYAPTLQKLKDPKTKKPIKVDVKAADPGEDTFALIAKVARGEEAMTVADSDILKAAMAYEKGVKAAFVLKANDPIAWGLRKTNPKLKSALDSFMIEKTMNKHVNDAYLADLDEIKARKVLRVLTRNNSTSFFIYKGEHLGFDYELAKQFAKTLGVRLEIIIPPSREALLQYLKEGRGDLAAAGLTVTEERAKEWAFTAPYQKISELLVVPSTDSVTKGLEDLRGKKVAVRKSSSYYQTLAPLQEKYGFTLSLVPEDQETEDILWDMGEGKYQASMADSNIVEVETTFNRRIRSAGAVGEVRDVAWALRPDQPQLKAAADAFIKKIYKGEFYNLTVKKYFKDSKQMREAASDQRSDNGGTLSPFDDLTKRYAKQHELDWRLVASQMFTESRFDPKAKSWVGALGLMQVMPQTAHEMRIDDLLDPEQNIKAGLLLLDRYAHSLEGPGLKEKDRIRMALAAYNCGLGHVLDGRRLAADMGLNPDKWFGNVEKAMLELEKPAVAKKARYGFCRCSEPVAYVSAIQTRYEAYSKLTNLE